LFSLNTLPRVGRSMVLTFNGFYVLSSVILLLNMRCRLCVAERVSTLDESFEGVETRVGPKEVVYVLGDSHGDMHYFVYQLLSTKRFMLSANDEVMWATRTDGMCCCKSNVSQNRCESPPLASFTKSSKHDGVCCATPNFHIQSPYFHVQEQCDWSPDYTQKAEDIARGMGQHNFCPFEEGETDPKDFHVVIAGDAVDRGSKSLEILNLIRRLQQDEQHGSKLIFLLGNHEAYLLRYGFIQEHAYAYEWAFSQRRALFNAQEGSQEYQLLEWLRTRDVIYQNDRTLVMHGGLLPKHVAGIKEELESSSVVANGPNIVQRINDKARELFKQVWECVRSEKYKPDFKFMCGCGTDGQECALKGDAEVPPVLGAIDGLLWERSFTTAGNPSTCQNAKSIGQTMAVNFIVLGHTTHSKITLYCRDRSVLVFAVDTSWKKCAFKKPDGDKECDFTAGKIIPRNSDNYLPSSLHISRKLKWIKKCTYNNREGPECAKYGLL